MTKDEKYAKLTKLPQRRYPKRLRNKKFEKKLKKVLKKVLTKKKRCGNI